jgi:hypothetical protein
MELTRPCQVMSIVHSYDCDRLAQLRARFTLGQRVLDATDVILSKVSAYNPLAFIFGQSFERVGGFFF